MDAKHELSCGRHVRLPRTTIRQLDPAFSRLNRGEVQDPRAAAAMPRRIGVEVVAAQTAGRFTIGNHVPTEATGWPLQKADVELDA